MNRLFALWLLLLAAAPAALGQAFTFGDTAFVGGLATDTRWADSGDNRLLGGLDLAEWRYDAADNYVGTYTANTAGPMGMVRTPGTITSLKWWCKAVDASLKGYKIKLLRTQGTNLFDVVYSTTTQTAVEGTNEITGLAWSVLEGDQLAWWAEDADTKINCTHIVDLWPSIAGTSGYSTGEASGNGYSATTPGVDAIPCIAAYGIGPALLYLGDSILTGWPNYAPFLGGLTSDLRNQGLASNSIPWRVKNAEGLSASYLDCCSGKGIAYWLNTTNSLWATNAGAKVAWVLVGVNDIGAGWTWDDFCTNLVSIRSKFGASNPFFISEILPANTLDDTQSGTARSWNSKLFYWANTNSAICVSNIHDAFGQNRESTSQLDNLKADYSADGVHLNNAGLAEYAKWVKTNVSSYLK